MIDPTGDFLSARRWERILWLTQQVMRKNAQLESEVKEAHQRAARNMVTRCLRNIFFFEHLHSEIFSWRNIFVPRLLHIQNFICSAFHNVVKRKRSVQLCPGGREWNQRALSPAAGDFLIELILGAVRKSEQIWANKSKYEVHRTSWDNGEKGDWGLEIGSGAFICFANVFLFDNFESTFYF